jgi:hypothetical protein
VTAAETDPHPDAMFDDSGGGLAMFLIFSSAVLIATGGVALIALVGAWWMVGLAFCDPRSDDDSRRGDDHVGHARPTGQRDRRSGCGAGQALPTRQDPSAPLVSAPLLDCPPVVVVATAMTTGAPET